MNAPATLADLRVALPRHYRIEHADARAVEQALALRRAVFCDEQGLFSGSDRDAVDETATILVARAVGAVATGPVVGTVRIHRVGAGEWQGSRLAVAAEFRRVGALGAALIQLAVRSATSRGCRRFVAQVQGRNQVFFERLHWRALTHFELHGQPHVLMEADLSHYPRFAPGAPERNEVHRGRP